MLGMHIRTYNDPHRGVWSMFHFPSFDQSVIPDSVVAWHGTHWYTVGSIVRDGNLKPGQSLPRGIYCHKNGSKSKAQSYSCYSPIGGGPFVAPLFELGVRNPVKIRGDQWLVADPQNCCIKFLHVHMLRQSDLAAGTEWIALPPA